MQSLKCPLFKIALAQKTLRENSAMQAIWTGWNEDSAQHEIEKFKAMRNATEKAFLWSVRKVKTLTPPNIICHGRFADWFFIARRSPYRQGHLKNQPHSLHAL